MKMKAFAKTQKGTMFLLYQLALCRWCFHLCNHFFGPVLMMPSGDLLAGFFALSRLLEFNNLPNNVIT